MPYHQNEAVENEDVKPDLIERQAERSELVHKLIEGVNKYDAAFRVCLHVLRGERSA
jgi:hypothetical protein